MHISHIDPPSSPSEARRPRIGFLFNHEGLHQVAHLAPVVSALRRRMPGADIELLASSAAQAERAAALLDPAVPPPPVRLLGPGAASVAFEWLSGGIVPMRRMSVLRRHRDLLAGYDALVVPETTSTRLKTRHGLEGTRLIHLPHGAGDRSIGFSPELRHFDLLLLAGPKIRDRMIASGHIRPGDQRIVGYPKFDTIAESPPAPVFANGRPTVLYNPHFDPRLSSWYDFGEKVLTFFARQDRFNLIFAPHVMLFRRRWHGSVEHRRIRRRRPLPERFAFSPHIHIDLGSDRSVDMSYTRAADIYLGDASSQIYEFLMTPRPAIFLNAAGASWQDDPDFAHWRLGEVIDYPGHLADALERAEGVHPLYREAQIRAFRDTFSLDPARSSADRAAEAIADYLAGEAL